MANILVQPEIKQFVSSEAMNPTFSATLFSGLEWFSEGVCELQLPSSEFTRNHIPYSSVSQTVVRPLGGRATGGEKSITPLKVVHWCNGDYWAPLQSQFLGPKSDLTKDFKTFSTLRQSGFGPPSNVEVAGMFLLSANPYDVQVEKLECIELIQKFMGTHLLDLKSETKEKKLRDGKSLSGRKRPSDILILKIQRYYSMAIRNNINDLHSMKTTVRAVDLDLQFSNESPQHGLCPAIINVWCK
ncbi:uncharacterized protein TNCV_1443061 [Trichonephila clavipes]|nr:uncharacterized protein TNCV_1443061 [Trichonephila clavipes]